MPVWAQTVTSLYKQARQALDNQDYPAYLRLTQKMDSIRPNSPVILQHLVQALAYNQQEEATLNYLEKLFLINPDSSILQSEAFKKIPQSTRYQAVKDLMRENLKPVLNSQTAFEIKERDLHAESIAFDTQTKTWYISSVYKRKVLKINAKGETSDFINSEKDGLKGVLGMKIDGKRRHLWLCSTGLSEMQNSDSTQVGKSAVHQYDLKTGRLLQKYEPQDADNQHFFGDLLIHPDGDVYVSDSGHPAIYKINAKNKSIEKFIHLDKLSSLQGLDFSADKSQLFFVDYLKGIFKLELKTKTIQTIDTDLKISLKGIDGLYFYQNSLVCTQNGLRPMRVTQYFLNEKANKIIDYQILERNNPLLNEPTLGQIIQRDFYYVANSSWGAYTEDMKLNPEKMPDIVILKVKLKEKK
jgi:sugar lactone lactonase YvrE